MPFVSEEQRRACYAKDDPAWDCKEWEAKTPAKLPRKVRNRLAFNAKKRRKLKPKAAKKASINPLKMDPTRTATLRRKFTTDIKKRFARLKLKIRQLIHHNDALALKDRKPLTFKDALGVAKLIHNFNPKNDHQKLTANVRDWEFATSSEKIQEFQKWLEETIGQDITGPDAEALWKAYTQEGFAKGAGRAFDDTRQAAIDAEDDGEEADDVSDFYAGSKEEFLRSAFANEVSVDKVKLLAERTFTDLEGVTDVMSTKMSRILADGLVKGESPYDIAGDLEDELDISESRAEMIARTEIIRAHAEGQLEALDQLGVEEVGVMVEWSTTGDGLVCPECEAMEGVVMSLDEAAGQIPLHPN